MTDTPDISTIMVDAAEAERAKYHIAKHDRDGNYAVFIYPARTCPLVDSYETCCQYVGRLVVQAQLRALHDAGYGIGLLAAHGTGDDWRVEGPDLVSAALRENG